MTPCDHGRSTRMTTQKKILTWLHISLQQSVKTCRQGIERCCCCSFTHVEVGWSFKTPCVTQETPERSSLAVLSGCSCMFKSYKSRQKIAYNTSYEFPFGSSLLQIAKQFSRRHQCLRLVQTTNFITNGWSRSFVPGFRGIQSKCLIQLPKGRYFSL